MWRISRENDLLCDLTGTVIKPLLSRYLRSVVETGGVKMS